jgi:hypothetical protein
MAMGRKWIWERTSNFGTRSVTTISANRTPAHHIGRAVGIGTSAPSECLRWRRQGLIGYQLLIQAETTVARLSHGGW